MGSAEGRWVALLITAITACGLVGCNGLLGIGQPGLQIDDAARDAVGDADDAHDAARPDAAPQSGILVDFRAEVGVHATAGVVTSWDDQSGHGFTASTASATGPLLTMAVVNGANRPVIRFDGTNFLVSSPHVPATGTVFAVYSSANQVDDRRVFGWEDTPSGTNGVTLIPSFPGTSMALFVARNSAADGDLLGGASVTAAELDIASWGSAGTTFERHLPSGQILTFSRVAILSVTDGGLPLHVGGPGILGSLSAPLQGDIAVLRVYDHQLTATESASVAATLY